MTYESPAMRDARIDVAAVLGAVLRRLPRIVIVTLLLMAATFVLLMFSPRLYESSASILVEPRSNPYVRASNEQAPTLSGGEAGVVSSQIELLKSRDTLVSVIDQLDLRSVPEFNGGQAGFSPLRMVMQLMGRSTTPVSVDEVVLGTLYDRLTVVQERDSRIISVLVRSTDPQLAADIANAVANAHVARRAQLSISDTAEASSWLLDEIERLRVSVREAESAVARFKVENDLFTGANNTSLLDQQLSTIATQITDAQGRKNTALSRAALIRGLIERGQPIEGVPDVQDSVVIQRLSEEKARLQGEHAQRSATLLPNHPSIRSLAAQVAELDRQIRLEGQKVAEALEAEAQIEADLEASLQADLARLKATASTATQDTVELDSLQREAKAQRDLLEAYLLRYNEASSRVDGNSALPDVRVVSVAAPSVSPASPQTTLILVAVAIVSVAVQFGLVVFGELMSGRAIVSTLAPAAPRQDELETVPFHADELEPGQRWEEPEPEPEPEAAGADEEVVAGLESVPDEVAPEPEPDLQSEEEDAPPSHHAEAEPVRIEDIEAARAFIRAFMDKQAADATPPAHLGGDNPPDEAEDLRPSIEPVVTPRAEPAARASVTGLVRYADLASDLVLGRTHLLLLADHDASQPSLELAEELVRDALAKGLSVALVDGGSARPTAAPGLSDLSTGDASFGDVVQKSADNSFAEVSWGQGANIDRKSSRPATLVEALGDIYEVVVVLTGRVGGQTSLPCFADLGGRVVLVAGGEDDLHAAESVRRRLEEAGLERVDIAARPEPVAA